VILDRPSSYLTIFQMQQLAHVTLLVQDYDEALAFYTQKLGFHLVSDTPLSATKRWVVVVPPGEGGSGLLLAKADDAAQQSQVGNQAGGRVFLFLNTDDFWRDYHAMLAQGVRFHETPREEVYATVAVFEDLYGNLWDLLQPKVQSA
jgi:catechol 2,3-dioxygenase-like lactoylglutathione lyase family enzyme